MAAEAGWFAVRTGAASPPFLRKKRGFKGALPCSAECLVPARDGGACLPRQAEGRVPRARDGKAAAATG